ncbi:MAG: histidine phosphatase family protein [Candidatus Pacebacteria bacterium]|nr:histidine phosphatase family protein [Candidatus Paceibacterota bacterium]
MKIIFVRHGATASNKLGRIMSRSNDEPLSEEGLSEVVRVASSNFPNLEYDMVFASPLKRASQTAREFAKLRDLSVSHHDGVLEREFGALSNKTWDEVNQITEGGLNHSIWNTSTGFDFSPYGGETEEETRARIQDFINHLTTNHSNSRPLVVTHGGVLRTLYALYPDHKIKGFGNVSIHEFEV